VRVTLPLAPDMVLAAPVWGNPYINCTALLTLLLTDDPCAARIACIGDLCAASLGQLSLVDGDGAVAALQRGALRRSATAFWALLPIEWAREIVGGRVR